jgi:hypothetical protein
MLLIPIAGFGSNITSNEVLLIVFTVALGYLLLLLRVVAPVVSET